jgi:hypothetical protein
MKFAYADPPYLGQGKKRYGDHPEAGIWDSKEAHLDLIARLCNEFSDGWVLSCNPADLRWILPACPELTRVGAWVKPFHQIRPTSVQFAWEPVVFYGGRKIKLRRPMVRDWISHTTMRKTGTIGSKPEAFNRWVLDLLGYDPNEDEVHDLFPGSGGMGRVLTT